MRKVRHCGACKVHWIFTLACAAYNLVRVRNLTAPFWQCKSRPRYVCSAPQGRIPGHINSEIASGTTNKEKHATTQFFHSLLGFIWGALLIFGGGAKDSRMKRAAKKTRSLGGTGMFMGLKGRRHVQGPDDLADGSRKYVGRDVRACGHSPGGVNKTG
jgi:hypothetical protein